MKFLLSLILPETCSICMYSSFFISRKYFLLLLWFGAQFLHHRPATYRMLFIPYPYLLFSLWSFLSFVSTYILRVWRKSWKKSFDQPRQHIKKQRHYLADTGLSSQSYGFPNSHVWMWKLDWCESWALKNWCFWTVMLEKTLESPLDCKETQSVHPKGDQSWMFIGRTDAKAEAPTLGPPHAKSWLIGKRPWCWERLKAGGEGDNRGWDGWLVSLTQWVWASSWRWWRTGKPGVLQSMTLQRVRHNWATEQ